MQENLLLTGPPGVGKTTVLRRVVEALGSLPLRGFLTEEIRASGQRVGFRIQTLDGQAATLAHAQLRSTHRVGRYAVDVGALERIVEAILIPEPRAEVYLIDEIGKMECLSPRFVAAVERLLEGPMLVVATIAEKGGGFMQEVKRRPDVECWEVTRANRDDMPAAIRRWLAERGAPVPPCAA